MTGKNFFDRFKLHRWMQHKQVFDIVGMAIAVHKCNSFSLKNVAVGSALLLTLGTTNAEGKTTESQPATTEVAMDIPGESAAPMTESVEQASTPNYINQAKAGISKYYPQYKEYFKELTEIFDIIGRDLENEYNKAIQENLSIFFKGQVSEKDKITITVMAIEMINGRTTFTEDKNIIKINKTEGYDIRKGVAEEVNEDLSTIVGNRIKTTNQIMIIMKQIDKKTKAREYNSKEDIEETMIQLEEHFPSVEYSRIKGSKRIQTIIEMYINANNKIGRAPKGSGKRITEEFNSIK